MHIIDLVFGDSVAGSLMAAKSAPEGEHTVGVIGIIETTERGDYMDMGSHMWTGAAMEGSPSDVAPLSIYLDIGDLSDMDDDMRSRRVLLETLFGDFGGVPEPLWNESMRTLKRLKGAGRSGEAVRIWFCDGNPTELCGLAFICHMFESMEVALSVVQVPNYVRSGDAVKRYRGTGDIEPEMFGMLLRYEREVPAAERKMHADRWRNMVRENAPLRAAVNGEVIGVPDAFYDFAIRASMGTGEIRIAKIIGEILMRLGGVSDRWLYLRIVQMMRTGELIQLAPAEDDHPYSGIVKRGDRWQN